MNEIIKRIKDISAVILYKNEKEFIKKTIDHVYPHVNEIILCDDNSLDKSYEICKNYNDIDNKIFNIRLSKVISDNWGIVDKKNFALAWVNCWWTLIIDADEYIEEGFWVQLSDMLKDKDYDAYAIPRKNYIDGEWIKTRINEYGKEVSTYPDYQLRLFRARGRYSGSVHEDLVGLEDRRRLFLNQDGPHIIHNKTKKRQDIQDHRYLELIKKKYNFHKFKFMEYKEK